MIAILNSCASDEVALQKNNEDIVDFVEPSVVKTPEDIRKANTILEVTRVLRKIYKDQQVVEEVNAAIATGYYEDETVLLKDLLNPSTSPIYEFQSFKDRSVARGFKPGLFKTKFEKELGISNLPDARTEDLYYYDNGVSIYFPYSDDTQYSTYPVTVLPATVESDRASAQHPLCDDLNATTLAYCNQTVMVNDAYTGINPTHITGMGATPSENSTSSSYCTAPFRVGVGYVRINYQYQYDKLISFTSNGGGSEINWITAKTSQASTTVNTIWYKTDMPVSRKAIRNGDWVPVMYHLISWWNSSATESLFGVYEKDSGLGTKYFTGSLSGKDNGGNNVSNIYSIGVSTGNDIISNNVRQRVYFIDIYTNYGNTAEFLTGYGPLFLSDDGKVSFSLPLSCF